MLLSPFIHGIFYWDLSCIVLIHGMDPYSCLHNHVLLCSRGSMIYYLKGILGTLICYTLGYSFPQTTFLSLLKVFGVLVVFNEAQGQRDCVYKLS